MMKQLIFLALAIVCGVLIIRFYTGRLTAAAQEGWQHISQSVAKDRMDSGDPVVVLDVRTEGEFSEGHIPGAVCLPNETIDEATAATALPDKTAEILIYCRSGRRSAEAAGKLARLGYAKVSDFGGVNDWPYDLVAD